MLNGKNKFVLLYFVLFQWFQTRVSRLYNVFFIYY